MTTYRTGNGGPRCAYNRLQARFFSEKRVREAYAEDRDTCNFQFSRGQAGCASQRGCRGPAVAAEELKKYQRCWWGYGCGEGAWATAAASETTKTRHDLQGRKVSLAA